MLESQSKSSPFNMVIAVLQDEGAQMLRQLSTDETERRHQAATTTENSPLSALQEMSSVLSKHQLQRNILVQRQRPEVLELMTRTAFERPEVATL